MSAFSDAVYEGLLGGLSESMQERARQKNALNLFRQQQEIVEGLPSSQASLEASRAQTALAQARGGREQTLQDFQLGQLFPAQLAGLRGEEARASGTHQFQTQQLFPAQLEGQRAATGASRAQTREANLRTGLGFLTAPAKVAAAFREGRLSRQTERLAESRLETEGVKREGLEFDLEQRRLGASGGVRNLALAGGAADQLLPILEVLQSAPEGSEERAVAEALLAQFMSALSELQRGAVGSDPGATQSFNDLYPEGSVDPSVPDDLLGLLRGGNLTPIRGLDYRNINNNRGSASLGGF